MFSQSADEPAADQSPAPIGMRELPPQPARPVMPVYSVPVPGPSRDHSAPGPDDSVVARDDHVEGTFTSRGTVVVMGSVKGRIEAVRVRIEDGATVEADVIVDEAIIAGMFSGNLTCRERLEAHASGRINGHVETFKLMLHEGASVEGEMHMLSDAPRDASMTVRGTAPLRGEARPEGRSQAPDLATGAPAMGAPATGAQATGAPGPATGAPGPAMGAPATGASATGAPAAKPAPIVTPSSVAKTSSSTAATPRTSVTPTTTPAAAPAATPAPASAPSAEATAARQRSAIAETLRLETMRVAPRATTSARRPSNPVSTGSPLGNGSRGRGGTTPTGF